MRLQLTRRGDYGVRAMLALARDQAGPMSAPEIARVTGAPSRFVSQVMGDLVSAGLVAARIGRAGGYRLARPASRITILQVVEAIEGDSRRRLCVLGAGACSREGACDVHAIFSDAQDALLMRLGQATLASTLAGASDAVGGKR